VAVPLPGFRDAAQLRDLVEARWLGPLLPDAMRAIDDELGRG